MPTDYFRQMRPAVRVIINADDFGFSAGTTDGILRAHRDGIVTSTTLLANMPDAAPAIARLPEAPHLGAGIHLNCSQGRPLSREGLALAEMDGVMRHTARSIIRECCRRPSLLRAIEAEFDAQVHWAIDRGVRPTHLDSHRHSHAFPPIFAIVARLAARHRIPYIRRHREHLPGNWPSADREQLFISRTLTLFGMINSLLAPHMNKTHGTWGIAHTGRIDAAWLVRAAQRLRPGVTEIMTHPGVAGDADPSLTRLTSSRESELAALCDPRVKDAFDRCGVQRVHYGQLEHGHTHFAAHRV